MSCEIVSHELNGQTAYVHSIVCLYQFSDISYSTWLVSISQPLNWYCHYSVFWSEHFMLEINVVVLYMAPYVKRLLKSNCISKVPKLTLIVSIIACLYDYDGWEVRNATWVSFSHALIVTLHTHTHIAFSYYGFIHWYVGLHHVSCHFTHKPSHSVITPIDL